MITNAKQWAIARGLQRKNPVHQEEEYRVPTDETFDFSSSKLREAEGSGSMMIEDPENLLLNFGDLSAEQTMLCLNTIICRSPFGQNTVFQNPSPRHTPPNQIRRGASSAPANQIAAQSAAAAKLGNLPIIQQNQDPFSYWDTKLLPHFNQTVDIMCLPNH